MQDGTELNSGMAEIPCESEFLVGLDQLVQRLANDASANYQAGQITADIFHELITNYTHLRAQIRFRGRDIKKCQPTTGT
jgi:hypothetical protein